MLSLRPDAAPQLDPIRLADYQPPLWLVDGVRLEFSLHETATRVRARLSLRRNPDSVPGPAELHLDGRKLELISASIDGKALTADEYILGEEGITIPATLLPNDQIVWECETEISPETNTALEGLYMSRDMYCTQCEAQGFRKITYYPDRPDVMATFYVRIEADKARFPVLLSNGNRVETGDLADGKHFAEWTDPFPKPAYLFALVAGDLAVTRDSFATVSGRDVALEIYTRAGDEPRTLYALDALKRSMAWDERRYGREYDLDLFMIVAVDDFNMGAMENKGLNIFNSKYILASPETATDRDYELIESVVAHEYFHNWTGNRITCRDWFQLCLKEGLTVFRDQQFSEDERSASVMRIDGVKTLRARQFREDAGPLAPPVRPNEYVEINNFYTATVYEKGAELVRMLQTIVGEDGYRASLDLYFDRHDGQACTIEQFVKCFEDATGENLQHFSLWWSQAGTPRVSIKEHYDPAAQRYTLTLTQETPTTPGQPVKAPLDIPIKIGLLTPEGAELTSEDRLVRLNAADREVAFEGVHVRPIPSINRGFSAPIIVNHSYSDADRAVLMSHDSDLFNRWDVGHGLAVDSLLGAAIEIGAGRPAPAVSDLTAAIGGILSDDRFDPAYRALAATLPSEDELAGEMASRQGAADPDAIHAARDHVRRVVAESNRRRLLELYADMTTPGAYRPSAEDAGKRALKNVALSFLAHLRQPETLGLAERQFAGADNMTDQLPALTALVHSEAPNAGEALGSFYHRWKTDPLVLGKWFGVQASSPAATTLERVTALTEHPAFEWKNPNKFRALIGAFAMANPSGFHRKDGAGYRFYADWLIRLDPVNPQTTARLIGAFETWKRYDAGRQALMRAELERIGAAPGLSKDSSEIVARLLAA
ncbi:MAG: aminopeptidase N [Rhodobacteraceae bacterium]|nr:aminopeptidase N [Paracoccaceae bacterium]